MSIILDGTLGITSVTGAASLTAAGPAFSAYSTSAQTLSNGSTTKVTLNNTTFDTNSNFDKTTNYRFTPTVAGYYQINACMSVTSNLSTTSIAPIIYKNGSIYKIGSNTPGTSSGYPYANVSDIVYCNGSSDYIELYLSVTSVSNVTTNANLNACYMSGAMVRSA